MAKIWVYFTIETEAEDTEQKKRCSFYIPDGPNQSENFEEALGLFEELRILRDRAKGRETP